MSPTVLRIKNYRFFFFSREDSRMHVHIASPDGEAKFWLEPVIALGEFEGFSQKQLKELNQLKNIKMKSKKPGKIISKVEVQGLSPHGFWLWVNEREFYLSYQDYPWFYQAKVTEIFEVELLRSHHLYWPKLDIDLELKCLENPQQYPLMSSKGIN